MTTITGNRNKGNSRIFREASAVWAIICREITVAFKSPSTLVFTILMPVIMMGMVGGNLTQNMAGGLGFDFGKFMLVGMIVNMLFMVTSQGIATLVDDSEDNFSEELLIAPVSRYAIVMGKICGSMFSAIVSMSGTLIVGLFMGISLALPQLLSLLALSPFLCLPAGAIAMLFIGMIKNRKAANMAVMLVTMPQMFLSGAIIPITNSTGILWLISRILPMTYSLDLARAVLYAGTPDFDSIVLFNPVVSVGATLGITFVCLIVGTFLYARSEKNR